MSWGLQAEDDLQTGPGHTEKRIETDDQLLNLQPYISHEHTPSLQSMFDEGIDWDPTDFITRV